MVDLRAKSTSRGLRHWMSAVPSLDTWLDCSSTSSVIISEASSIKDSEIMGLDFIDNSDIVGSVRDVEVLVYREPVGSHPPSWYGSKPQLNIAWFLRRSIAPQ